MIFDLEAEGEIEGQDLIREIQISHRSLFGEMAGEAYCVFITGARGRPGPLWPQFVPFREPEQLCW